MKRFLLLIPALVFAANCGPNRGRVERKTENGVEVVINHKAPYPDLKGPAMKLEKLFQIDTEKPEIRDLGIPDIFGFDVDSRGRIIVLRQINGEGDFVYVFDDQGRFVKSFGRKGQGPGELENPHHLALDGQDRIMIFDGGRERVSRYDKDGGFLGPFTMNDIVRMTAGPGDNLITKSTTMKQESGKAVFSSSLKRLSADFRELGVVDSLKVEMNPGEFIAEEPVLCWSASKDRLFVTCEGRGYEIRVYDNDGKLARIIRKEYQPVPVTAAYRAKILKPVPAQMQKLMRFPEFHPPLKSLTADEDGRLLVVTFDEGDKPGEFQFDIFDESGVFVGKKSLNAFIWEGVLWARMKADRFYSLEEKENGFKEIAVYRLRWE
jgi:hypothetical protein